MSLIPLGFWKSKQGIVTDGLILRLDASETSSYPGTGTAWNDISGNGNHFTLYNSPSFSNGLFTFNQQLSHYALSNNTLNLSTTDKLTISIVASVTVNGFMLCEHSTNFNNNNAFGVLTGPDVAPAGLVELVDHIPFNYNVRYNMTNLKNNVLFNITFTSDRSQNGNNQIKVYFNGVNETTTTSFNTDLNGNYGSYSMYLGCRNANNLFMSGRYKSLLIYNRILSQSEIENIIPYPLNSSLLISTNRIFYFDPANSSSYPGSGTSLTDLSGNGYTSTLNGGVGFSSTDGGGSLIFDGNDDFISVPTTSANGFINQSFTLEAWLKPATSPPSEQIFFSITQVATTGSRLHCRIYSNGQIRFAYFADDLDTGVNAAKFGEWQHIAMRYRSGDDTSTTFVNGVQVAQGNNGPLLSSTNRVVRIGDWNGAQRFKGSIGAIYSYQAALTDNEIVGNFNVLRKRYGI